MASKGRKRTKVPRAKKIPGQKSLKGFTGKKLKVKPSAQDMIIAKNIVGGMKKGEALVAAGVSPGNARGNSAEILQRPGVQAAMSLVMAEAGITPAIIAEKLKEGMGATKVISANLLMLSDQVRPDEIIDATAIAEAGRERALIRVEDFAIRHKYLETSCKLLDLFPRDGGSGQGMDPSEEQSMIAQAEQEAGKRDISRYTTTA